MSELASIIDGEQWLCDRMLANLRAELSAGTLTDNGVPIVNVDLLLEDMRKRRAGRG